MRFVVVLALLASVHATGLPAMVNTGVSAVSRADDGLGNYAFGYNEDHATGGTFFKEKGAPGVKIGSYGLRDADGRMRVVNYIADSLGYRATISTNEKGTDVKQSPAATMFGIGAAPIIAIKNYATPALTEPKCCAAAVALASPPMAAKIHAMPTMVETRSFASPALIETKFTAPTLAMPAISPIITDKAIVAPMATMSSSYRVETQHIPSVPIAFAAAPIVEAKTFAAPALIETKSFTMPAPSIAAVPALIEAKSFASPIKAAKTMAAKSLWIK